MTVDTTKMKRPRTMPKNSVSIEYPCSLFIINDGRDQTVSAYVYQPLMAEESGRLITRLRGEVGTTGAYHIIDAFLSILCADYSIKTEESMRQNLNFTCLVDTEKHRIASIEEIPMNEISHLGPIQVEYFSIVSPPVVSNLAVLSSDYDSNDDDSFSLSSTDTEDLEISKKCLL